MIRGLIVAAATAAVSGAVYRAFQQGRFDGLIARLTPASKAPPLALAYQGANVSRPAPAHPWPVDPRSIARGSEVADAA